VPDKGLAGAFSANIIKAAQAFMNEHSAQTSEMIPIGRKGRDYFKRRHVKFLDEYIGLTAAGQVKYSEAVEIAQKLIKTFTEDKSIDKVFIVFTEFKTVLSQTPVIEQLLPIPKHESEGEAAVGPQASIFTSSRPRRSSASCFQNRSKHRSTKEWSSRSHPSRARE
jgi:F-type H+-transporting ATPase subunit gamma